MVTVSAKFKFKLNSRFLFIFCSSQLSMYDKKREKQVEEKKCFHQSEGNK